MLVYACTEALSYRDMAIGEITNIRCQSSTLLMVIWARCVTKLNEVTKVLSRW